MTSPWPRPLAIKPLSERSNSTSCWLELKSSIPGRGTYLLEHRGASQVFDELAALPRIVLALGGKTKRQFFHTGVPGSDGHNAVVFRRNSPLRSTIMVDCELHNQKTMSRMKAGPMPETTRQHRALLPQTSHPIQIAQFAWKLYWRTLAPFASVILLFVEDFAGGLDGVADVLVVWARESITTPVQSPPRILLLHSNRTVLDIKCFQGQLKSRLKASLLQLDPFDETANFQADLLCQTAFESIQLLSSSSRTEIVTHTEQMFGLRAKAGYAFNSEHLKYLLQKSVSQFFVHGVRPFDFYQATRLHNPIPDRLEDHIVNFATAVFGKSIDPVLLVASALDMEAHPPGMHHFRPESTFDHFYGQILRRVSKRIGRQTFHDAVRQKFSQLASERRYVSSTISHFNALGRFRDIWAGYYCDKSCLACLAQAPSMKLDCGHQLCETCALNCGSFSEPDLWRICISHCPLCNDANQLILSIRPPTAGVRVLKLEGLVDSKAILARFLRDFQTFLGLSAFPLRDQFDLIIGSNIGAFFAQTVFLEKWDLADCQYHLPQITAPKCRQSTVDFGKGLKWDLSKTRQFNGPDVVLLIRDQAFSNKEFKRASSALSLARDKNPSGVDITVEYGGGSYNSGLLRQIAGKMHSYLFYVELLSVPTFYSAPGSEVIQIRLLCRLPHCLPNESNAPMLDFLSKLRQQKTRIIYGADGMQHVEPLVTPELWDRCRKGQGFSRSLSIVVKSSASVLDIRVGDPGCSNSVSNCPYKLSKLIRDQGLDSVFGRKDCRLSKDTGLYGSAIEEIHALGSQEMRNIYVCISVIASAPAAWIPRWADFLH
ncbi:hypothetical protein B0T14DRAFT_443704 [Immersiella caudata]|uniref:RING-type domain-containing protein n=1 Tax=Immersiella caudata TaxID=314043 RepID=A0AA39XCV5_9PEZI|nr:hypothetical protein B0T14DRAFT_443704 [Immersiella caudata]